MVNVFRDPDRCFLDTPRPGRSGRTTILDISHESLIRHWGRLRAWVGAEAASAEVYRRLDQTARLWSEGLAGLCPTSTRPYAGRRRPAPTPPGRPATAAVRPARRVGLDLGLDAGQVFAHLGVGVGRGLPQVALDPIGWRPAP